MPTILKIILRFFTVDLVRKIFALIFAFGLWFFVAIDTNYQYPKIINITYAGLPRSFVLVDSLSQLKVIFSGRGRNLFNIWLSPPRAICSLSKVHTGENDILTGDLIIPISDVNFAFEINSFTVVIDEKLEKLMKVVVPLKGSLKEGYSINQVYVLDTIVATGPKELLKDFVEIFTDSLDLKNQSTTFEKGLNINPPPHIQLSKNTVQVKVEIDTTIERVFTKLPIKVLKGKNQVINIQRLNLDTLVIAGARRRIDGIGEEDIIIRINATNLSPGEYNLPAEIILPEYIKPLYSSPQRFRVRVESSSNY
ncbi:MAG: hypothetical protein ABIL70_01345 [candidate division WOR-3 bacterium]